FFSSRGRHTRSTRDWSSDVCSSDLDIRETSDQLEGRFHGEAEVIPLFGRLSSGDQQRVFARSLRRKIVIATNIAETSLTIPGIRSEERRVGKEVISGCIAWHCKLVL